VSFTIFTESVQKILDTTSYINDLPNIKTSAPIIFADDASISFAHSNLIDFNKNIHIVFATLNKWFRANQLSLNFNKTNYVCLAMCVMCCAQHMTHVAGRTLSGVRLTQYDMLPQH